MENLRSTYRVDNDEEQQSRDPLNQIPPPPNPNNLMPPPPELASLPTLHPPTTTQNPSPSSSAAGSGDDEGYDSKENGDDPTPVPPQTLETLETPIPYDDDGGLPYPPRKKQNPLSIFPSIPPPPVSTAAAAAAKKPNKKKGNNVWTKPTSRKGKKKGKNLASTATAPTEDAVLITPVPRPPEKSDDAPDAQICLSRIHKAEKVKLSDDRLAAGSTKGYRMVRATRGVVEGSWYFEIRVVRLGPTGHTRLGWTTEKGDLQAPVGYDGNSYGFRDIDGCKIHKATRDKYGDEGYLEGDVIGFYISLPNGELYAPKSPQLVWYKGQRYIYSADVKDEPPKVVPGSEISFFKNGVCQGVAFANLFGGRYYPAASMYTRPNQPNCEARFNFGPDFEFFPQDIGDRPTPRPMIESPYRGYDSRADAPRENGCNNS